VSAAEHSEGPPLVRVCPDEPSRVRGDSRSRSVPSGWRLVALIGTMSIFGPLCIDMYLPALPELSSQLHAGASATQLTLTACVVSIAIGQLVLGPISDRVGRRPPLLAGLAAFFVSSAACAIAPNIYVLTGFRLIEGLGGAAGIAISRSIVRDLHSGPALARFYATLMLATGLGPVLAPQIGSWILAVTSWRGVFAALALFGAILLALVWWRVPETLPPTARSSGSIWRALGTTVKVSRDRTFLAYALGCALAMGAVFSYVAGSSFVLQNVYRLSPQAYGLIFALTGCAMVAGAQLSGRLTGRVSSASLLAAGLGTMTAGGALLFGVVVARAGGLAGVIPGVVMIMAGWGLVAPNALALGMQRYPQSAGAASAVVGFLQFTVAAIVAPLPGLGGTADPLPMAILVAAFPALAIGTVLAVPARSATRAAIPAAIGGVPTGDPAADPATT
jgi:MFS transporter, DHA1 family, multidrug resistance protein